MAVATRPKHMVAVSKDSKLTPMGYIVWFSVPDRPVPMRTLRTAWLSGGLDASVLPKDPKAGDRFKRAMRTQEGRVTLDDGTKIDTDVRIISEDGEEIAYQISRVERDIAEQLVNFPKAMRVVYDRATEVINYEKLSREVSKQELEPMMEAIQDYFEQSEKIIEGRKVRNMVRDYIQSESHEQSGVVGLSGQNLRGRAGGVYFVPYEFHVELDGLIEALQMLYSSDGANYGVYTVPVADDKTEREKLRAIFLENTMDETKREIAEVADLLRKSRKQAVRSDVLEHHWGVLKALRRRRERYKALLKEEFTEINDLDEMAERQLSQLEGA